MTYEQKLLALTAIDRDIALRIRGLAAWVVYPSSIEVGDGFTLGGLTGRGSTPESAVNDIWTQATTLPPDKWLVLRAGHPDRRHVRWNGFMWEEVPR